MITELEKKFFETFGIEPKKTRHSCNSFWEKGIEDCPVKKCDICKYKHETMEYYPPITDRILLELICVLTKSKAMLPIICSENTQDLKDEILWDLIKAQTQFKKEIKHQVQELFKEN